MLKYSPFLFGVFWFDPPWRQTCCSFVAMSNPSRPLLVTDPTPCESEWFNATATVSIFQWLLVKSHLLSPEKYPYDIPLYTTIGLLLDQHPIPILSPYRCRILRMAWSLPSSCQTARVTGTSGGGFWELGLFSQNGIWYPHPFKRLLFRGGPYPKCKLHFGTDPPLKCKLGRWTSPRCRLCGRVFKIPSKCKLTFSRCPLKFTLKNVAYILGTSPPWKRWWWYNSWGYDADINSALKYCGMNG